MLDDSVVGKQVHVHADPGHHRARVCTQDHHQLLPAVTTAIKQWWEGVAGSEQPALDDAAVLEDLLRGATSAYTSVSGWTTAAQDGSQRLLKGHRKLLLELDCQFFLRKHVRAIEDSTVGAKAEGASLDAHYRWNHMFHMARNKHLLGAAFPKTGTWLNLDEWQLLHSSISSVLEARRAQYRKDCEKDQQTKLNRALAAMRDSFGKRRRTFQQALLKNPPRIPLWGVLSAHPTTVILTTMSRVSVLPFVRDAVSVAFSSNADGSLQATFTKAEDVTSTVLTLPQGECEIVPVDSSSSTLVADPDNKLAGIENFFGTNALGALPLCSRHMSGLKNMVCMSHVHCPLRELPPLEPASSFLPGEVFAGHNLVDSSYDSHLQEQVSEADFLHIVCTLPLRKAPGPDGIPNEVLCLLPPAVLDRMRAVVNTALTTGVFPKSWKDVEVTLMTKKAPAELLSNQHPIALCITVYKLFTIVLTSRLNSMVEENGILETEQEGGRRHCSTLSQLQCLDWQFQDARRCGKHIFALWIDTTNALATVNHQVLWSILRGYGLPSAD
eukprot:2462595-Rhodomonas_salina.2